MRTTVVGVLLLVQLFLLKSQAQTFDQAAEQRLNDLRVKLEEDAFDLGRQVEALYADRCDSARLTECNRGNYDHCLSSFPAETCPGGDEFQVSGCGNTCTGFVSFEASAVRLPFRLARGPDNNPTDDQVKEAICFSNRLDEYLINKRIEDQSYWDDLGFQPSGYYFGSNTGAFRIFPARRSNTCGDYDPRQRPWFTAGSSGPKNIIMLLDTSGSMGQFNNFRMELMKEAAERVVKTTTVADKIAIVTFADVASTITREDDLMFQATDENKLFLLEKIRQLEAVGSTNYIDGFDETFAVLDRTISSELNVDCNTAILFLTDGEASEALGTGLARVTTQLEQLSERLANRIYLFAYSISDGSAEIDPFPAQLACAVDGVWSKIETDEEIIESLSSYYRLFALGLGSGSNQDFAAWVEPYQYATAGVLGTTVSVPVYDRTKEPHLFLGVVGIDFVLEAFNAALGITDGTTFEALNRVVRFSTAKCPRLELSECELESYRRSGNSGDDALCGRNCTASEFVTVEEEQCPFVSDYPGNVWINVDNREVSYFDSVCCTAGESEAGGTCDAPSMTATEGLPIGLIVGVVIGAAVVLAGIAAYFYCRSKKPMDSIPDPVQPPKPPEPTAPPAPAPEDRYANSDSDED